MTDPDEPADACEALRSIGFDEIMQRALRRGLVERVATTTNSHQSALAPGRLYAQAAAMMWVYQWTERAIEEGVPQRAGAVVVAGCTAAVVAVWHLVRRGPSDAERASAEQAAREAAAPRAGPQVPAQAGPSPVPRLTGTDPPADGGSRRHPNQTCDDALLDALQGTMHQTCDGISSCSPSKINPKKLALVPCSEVRARVVRLQDCIRARQRIQDQCFGGIPDQAHAAKIEEVGAALRHCLELEFRNCSPSKEPEDS